MVKGRACAADGCEFKAALALAVIEASAIKIILRSSFLFQQLLFMSMKDRS